MLTMIYNSDLIGNRTKTVSAAFGVTQTTDVKRGTRGGEGRGQGSNITDSSSLTGEILSESKEKE